MSLKNDKNYTGEKITLDYIAKSIGVNKSTISREIKLGTYKDFDPQSGRPRSRYLASFGDGTYKKNQRRSHYKSKLKEYSPELLELSKLLNSGADPFTALCLYEQKHHEKFPLCEKSIYNYFKKNMLKLKRGTINPRKHKHISKKVQKSIQKGDNITLRCEGANTREEFGHWEVDLIIGAKGKSKECLFTIIERKTRLYLSFRLESKEMKNVVSLLDTLETKIGSENFKDIF